jgi:hypothetical protein
VDSSAKSAAETPAAKEEEKKPPKEPRPFEFSVDLPPLSAQDL